MPIIRPSPRTSTTDEASRRSVASRSLISRPKRSEASGEIVLCGNFEGSKSGLHSWRDVQGRFAYVALRLRTVGHASKTRRRPMHAERGMPEARPLPTHNKSGTNRFMIAGENASSAAKACIDFVDNKQPASSCRRWLASLKGTLWEVRVHLPRPWTGSTRIAPTRSRFVWANFSTAARVSVWDECRRVRQSCGERFSKVSRARWHRGRLTKARDRHLRMQAAPHVRLRAWPS